MAKSGSEGFRGYVQNLRRLMSSEVADVQAQASRPAQFRASLVDDPLPEKDSLTSVYEYHRHRATPSGE